MNREEIIAAIDAIEADPPICLPVANCNCPVCERYCELFGMFDDLDDKPTKES